MNAVVNISAQSFGNSKNYPTFVVRNVLKSFDQRADIQATAFNKAKFQLIRFYFGGFGRFAKTSRSFASLCLYILQIFCYQMRNVAKNLTADAQGVSASTANARKRVVLTPADITQPIYQVCFQIVHDLKDGSTHDYSELVPANSPEEALGLSMLYVKKKYHWYYLSIRHTAVTLKFSPTNNPKEA